MNLIEAVRQRRLVHWHDQGVVRTVEPHLFAQFPGARLVLIAFQIAGEPPNEPQQSWKVIDIGDGLNVEQAKTFRHPRPVPPHLLMSAQLVYASTSADV